MTQKTKNILSENSTHVYFSDGTVSRKPKEGLHTQGEWNVDKKRWVNEHGIPGIDISTDGLYTQIATIWGGNTPEEMKEAEANAELIVKAVNEKQALLDENEKLANDVKVLSDAANMVLDEWHSEDSNYQKEEPKHLEVIRKALNQTK